MVKRYHHWPALIWLERQQRPEKEKRPERTSFCSRCKLKIDLAFYTTSLLIMSGQCYKILNDKLECFVKGIRNSTRVGPWEVFTKLYFLYTLAL